MRGNDEARVVLTPIATPLPLTFLGLVAATTILSGLELHWIPATDARLTGWTLLAVPLPLQLTASIFGFYSRSATAATGSSLLAAAWLAMALVLINAPPGSFTPARPVGVLSFAVAAGLLVPAAADARGGSPLPTAAIGLASARFALTGVTAVTGSPGLRTATGIVGIAVAGVALYAALALELEGNSIGDTLVPTFKRGRSAEALTAPLDAQVDELEHEAGVRKNL